MEKLPEAPDHGSGIADEWNELMDDFPKLRSLLNLWSRASWPIPEASYELLGKDNSVIAQAELAWGKNKTALFDESQSEQARMLEQSGWSVFSIKDALANPSGFSLR